MWHGLQTSEGHTTLTVQSPSLGTERGEVYKLGQRAQPSQHRGWPWGAKRTHKPRDRGQASETEQVGAHKPCDVEGTYLEPR